MKKKCIHLLPNRSKFFKMLITMKLMALFFGLSMMHAFGNVYSQKVSIHLKDASVETFFMEIHKQTGFQYLYDNEIFPASFKVNVSVENVSLEQVLNLVFANRNFGYDVVENTIKVFPKPIIAEPFETKEDSIGLFGVVKDKMGTPMEGVTVFVKGTTIGTSTDVKGQFALKAPVSSQVLVVRMIGKRTQEILISGKIIFYAVVLEDEEQSLDEVQVIGYGTTVRRLSTSSIATVRTETLSKQSVGDPIQALQGRVSGLAITQNSGALGSGIDIQIRGINSVESGTQPLIIVDGAIISSQSIVVDPKTSNTSIGVGSYMYGSQGTNPFSIVNPDDIQSIEVLKDADATAIYGSRGANGVIIITTKKAVPGASKISVDYSTGLNTAAYLTPRLNLEQYLKMRQDAFATGFYNPAGEIINPVTATEANAPDLLLWSQTEATDWAEFEYGNPANFHKVNTSLSGGNQFISYLVSGGYSKQEDITVGSPFQERFNGRTSLNHLSLDNKFRVNFSASYAIDKLKPSQGGATTGSQGGKIQVLPPNMPMYAEDGTQFWPKNTFENKYLLNPLAVSSVNLSSVTTSLISNLDISYELFSGLFLKTQFGYNNQMNTYSSAVPSTAINPFLPLMVRSASYSQNTFQTLNFEPQINYKNKFGKNTVDFLLGATIFSRTSEGIGASFEGFTTDLLLDSWAAANTVTQKSSSTYYYKFASFFSRVNYNFDNRYLLNLTFRRDGSSRFGPENRYGNFGAAGFAWLFTNESFIRDNVPFLSYGKFRASFGTTGNDNIADNRYTSLFTSTNIWYNGATGLASTYLADPAIAWETSNKLDFGLELGFFKDRILATANKFRSQTVNMLLNESVSSPTGFSSFLTNMPGLIENKGWEFEVTTRNLGPESKFQWRTSFNLTLLKNQLLEFPDLENSSYANRLEIGKPLPSRNTLLRAVERNLIFEGVDPETGMPIYTDVDTNGIINSKDYQYIGSTVPRVYGGLGNTLSYMGFELDFFFQFTQQLATNHNYLTAYPGQMVNPSTDWVGNYWMQPGDETKYPRLYPGEGGTAANSNALTTYFQNSSAATDDVFFVRFKNIQLSYNFPSSILDKVKLKGASVYARGYNLYTWSSKELFKDPESAMPASVMIKSWTFGVQITL